jgi:hypothetical protein
MQGEILRDLWLLGIPISAFYFVYSHVDWRERALDMVEFSICWPWHVIK